MQPERKEAGGHGWWGSTPSIDVVVAAIAFLVGVAVMVDTYRLGAGWSRSGPQSGYFPFRIGAIICISSAVIFVRAFLAARSDRARFVRWERFRPVLAVLLPTFAYIAGIEFLGIYVASALFIAGFMRIAGRYGWLKTVLVSVISGVVLFWLFEIVFLVPLPKGPLEAMLGY